MRSFNLARTLELQTSLGSLSSEQGRHACAAASRLWRPSLRATSTYPAREDVALGVSRASFGFCRPQIATPTSYFNGIFVDEGCDGAANVCSTLPQN